MGKNAGKDMLIYIENAVTPGQYDLIGGMQSNALSINKETVDVTDKQSAPNRTLADFGIRSASISGNGVFDTTAATLIRLMTSILGVSNAGAIYNFKVVFGDGTTKEQVTGPFQIVTFERTGEYNGADTFSASLESAGALTYTPRVA